MCNFTKAKWFALFRFSSPFVTKILEAKKKHVATTMKDKQNVVGKAAKF